MERMESMEPISACYTTAYPEIQPDSGYGSRDGTENQAKSPPPPAYDEELVHKVRLLWFELVHQNSEVGSDPVCGPVLRCPWC